MNILRTTLITVGVIAASLGALLIPLKSTTHAKQTPSATGATIALVDSLSSTEASIPSVQEQIKTPSEQADVAPPLHTETLPLVEKLVIPPQEKGIAPMEASVEEVKPAQDPLTQPDEPKTKESFAESEVEPPPLDDSSPDPSSTEASLASVAASAVSLDPLPSLVDGYYEVSGLDQGPSFNRTALASRIRYPSLAKRQGIEGLVMLRLFISVLGKVERIEVEEDPGYGLAEAAVKAFTGLQGVPALLGGKAVPVTLRYPVRFSLE